MNIDINLEKLELLLQELKSINQAFGELEKKIEIHNQAILENKSKLESLETGLVLFEKSLSDRRL